MRIWKAEKRLVYTLTKGGYNLWSMSVERNNGELPGNSDEELEAIATLAASAPKLKEALQNLLSLADCQNNDTDANWVFLRNTCKEALALSGNCDG